MRRKRVATKMTVMKYQSDRCSKWPLSKLTVNSVLKWPLFYTKMTVISLQNDRYFPFFEQRSFRTYQNANNLKKTWPKWPLNYQNDRYKPKWPLWFLKMTVISSKVINGHFGSENNPSWPLWSQNGRYLEWGLTWSKIRFLDPFPRPGPWIPTSHPNPNGKLPWP